MSLTYRYYTAQYMNENNGIVVLGYHDITLPNHIQYDANDNPKAYLNYEPYSKVHVVGSVFGDFDLPINSLPRKIRYMITIDQTDGTGVLEIMSTDTLITFMRINGQVGVPVSLAQSVSQTQADKYRVGFGLISSITAPASFNFGGAISNLGQAVMAAHEGNIPKVQSVGSNGSFVSLMEIKTLYIDNMIQGEDPNHIGNLVYRLIDLNTIASGSFVMCRNAIVEIGGLIEEQREIIAKMESGFYLE